MSPQTTYNAQWTQLEAGFIYDLHPKTVVTRIADGSVAVGIGASEGATAGRGCKTPDAVGNKLVGITIPDSGKENADDGTQTYAQYDTVNILTQGAVCVHAEGSPAVGDPVWVRVSNGAGGTVEGYCRVDDDTNTAIQLDGAKFGSAASGGLAVIILNTPSN